MKSQYSILSASIVIALLMSLAACNEIKGTDTQTKKPTAVLTEMTDEDISSTVNKALKSDLVLGQFEITVVTSDGIVLLSGALDTQAQIDATIKIAEEASGAKLIVNDLVLYPTINLPKHHN